MADTKTAGSSYPVYQRCQQCDGTGGITCTLCRGIGVRLYVNAHTNGTLQAEVCALCEKKSGFMEICKACNGEKAIRLQKVSKKS